MGRKRGLPAKAREKLVAEEFMTAMEVEQKEAIMQAKPDDALFVVDAVGERMILILSLPVVAVVGWALMSTTFALTV